MADLKDLSTAVIGTGAIGGALIDRLVNGLDIDPETIVACEIDDARREGMARNFGVRTVTDPAYATAADLIVVAVPPPVVTGILAVLHERIDHRPLIVSFAAACPVAFMESRLPADTPVVRVNPNSPSLVGEGFNPVVFGTAVTGESRAKADSFLAALGTSVEVSDSDMNLYTALSAVGPTYFLPVFDAIVAAGMDSGLGREAATSAACETARGVAAMVEARSEDPEALKLYTGLRPLDHDSLRELVRAAIDDAHTRMAGVQQKVEGT